MKASSAGRGARAAFGRCLLAALSISWATAAEEARAGVTVWATGPSHRVLRTERPPEESVFFRAGGDTVTLHAARNEFAAFQLVFSGEGEGVTVERPVLEGPGGARIDRVDLFREHYIRHEIVSCWSGKDKVIDCAGLDRRARELGAPREFPVQFVPLGAAKHGAPFDVAEGRNEVVWVDVFVPEDAAPGRYAGKITAAGRALKLELTVWDFALPSVSHFPQWAYIGPEEIAWAFRKPHTEIRNMMPVFDGYHQMAHDHRLTLMEGFCYGIDYVKAPDRRFDSYYTGEAFKGPFGRGLGFELLPVSEVEQFLPYLVEQKWLNRAFVYLADEPGSREAYQEVLDRGKDVRVKTGGKVRRMVTEQYEPEKPDWPRLDAEVDIFCSGGAAPANLAELEKTGKVFWTYNKGGNGAPYTDAWGPALRTHAWSGFVTGARAWFFWDAGYVIDKQMKWRNRRREIGRDPARFLHDLWTDPLNFDEAKRPGYNAAWALRLQGDGLLIYPGQDAGVEGPLPCLRLKNLRHGSQDFEYLYLLEKMGRREAALAEASKLVGGDDYEKDGNRWDEARIRLGKILHAIGDRAIRAKLVPYDQYPNPVGHPDYYGGKRY